MSLDFEKIRFEQLVKNFSPKFAWTNRLVTVARMINEPHVDDAAQLPLRSYRTAIVIRELINTPCSMPLSWQQAKYIHTRLWEGLNPKGILVGDFRRCDVSVGRAIMPRHYYLLDMVHKVYPAAPQTEDDVVGWYTRFQCLHPFEDGNGRVGGVQAAVASYKQFGKFLAPLQ